MYFLNQVDESDLAALVEDSGTAAPPVCSCGERCAVGAVNTACPVCAVNMTECAGKEPEPMPEPVTKPEPEPEPIVSHLMVAGDVMSHMPLTNDCYVKETDSYDYTHVIQEAAEQLKAEEEWRKKR